MDYRHTEDFARLMETAAVRAHQLRGDAINDAWDAVGRALRHALRFLNRRIHISLEA